MQKTIKQQKSEKTQKSKNVKPTKKPEKKAKHKKVKAKVKKRISKPSETGQIKEKTKKEIKIDKKQIEQLIIKMSTQDIDPEKIGLILRDRYGIMNVKNIIGKTISQVLKENDLLKFPSDLMHLIKKANNLKKHFGKNRHDMTAKRGLQLTESKIRMLIKYYISKGILKKGFKYTEVRV
jgi:small subunit ribosomal protein S15